MSIFNELLPKLFEISKSSEKSISDELQAALKYLDKLADAYENGRGNIREKTFRNKTRITALQSINEDDGETRKTPENKDNEVVSSSENQPRRMSNKRSKDEVEGMSSPEVDKRQKRNASVKAQSNISKQKKEPLKSLSDSEVEFISSTIVVNVNLVQKLRREEVSEKSRGRRRKDDDKENSEPIPAIQIKQEKISILEPMESECLPTDVPVKQEPDADQAVMPPPVAPVPKPRKAAPPKASSESSEDETGSSRRRTARRKPADADTEAMPPPKPVASARSTRASSRAKLADEKADDEAPRTRKTRARKKVSESSSVENEKPLEESVLASPVEKRPKRTKRGQKATEKEQQKPDESQSKPIETISLKEERVTQSGPSSPILPVKEKSKTNLKKSDEEKLEEKKQNENKVQTEDEQKEESNSKPQKESKIPKQNSNDKKKNKSKKEIAEQQKELVVSNDIAIDETKVTVNDKMNVTVTINNEMDRTMVLPIGVYNHAPVTPTNICNNETVVIETCRETMVLEKHTQVNDATVVIDKDPTTNVTDDNSSILTEDNSAIDEEPQTPPKPIPTALPTSAVKEKVQQFEELASRTTRTKTRAMAKLEEQDNQTPPDKITKPVLSVEILNKMNNMIFNGKTQQVSSSASKPKALLPPLPKANLPASTSKLSSLSRHKEAAEESLRKEKEDARKKKEAMLEAKRELQRKRREEKMANALAARAAAERERLLALQAAQRGRLEKQAHAHLGKLERLKEAERRKLELARKAAETEERRRAEEAARQQRLAEDQRRADAARKKQLEEAEAMKKEAAMMAREIEKRQKEYMEKQKLKDKAAAPVTPGTPAPRLAPVHMADGFELLNSDSEDEGQAAPRVVPAWSTSRARKEALLVQAGVAAAHVDRLFGLRRHNPDLRDIFPSIARHRLQRTSSAVWRTPPRLPPRPPLPALLD